jgi:hypothetical protein
VTGLPLLAIALLAAALPGAPARAAGPGAVTFVATLTEQHPCVSCTGAFSAEPQRPHRPGAVAGADAHGTVTGLTVSYWYQSACTAGWALGASADASAYLRHGAVVDGWRHWSWSRQGLVGVVQDWSGSPGGIGVAVFVPEGAPPCRSQFPQRVYTTMTAVVALG